MSKYRNVKTEYDGRAYASKKEARRAAELDLLKKAGEVVEWVPQVRYPVAINDAHICTYVADFVVTWKDGSVTVEDCKGVRTREYILKRKLVRAVLGIEIAEK